MTRRKSPPPGQRPLRVGEELRHALASILAENHLADPDLHGKAVTVTEIRVSPDLTNATIFVVPLFGRGEAKEAERVVAALNRAATYFRFRLSERVKLRVSPRLRFFQDESFLRAGRIEALLHDPAVARDLKSGRDKEP